MDRNGNGRTRRLGDVVWLVVVLILLTSALVLAAGSLAEFFG
jgi:hypothetical protein